MYTCTHFCVTGLADGSVLATIVNPAVSTDLLHEIQHWQSEGATTDDVLARLRQRTVPTGYCVHTFVPGTVLYTVHIHVAKTSSTCAYKYTCTVCTCTCTFYVYADKTESRTDMLRSILAQLDFTYQVNLWQSKGVPFKDHLYVPEIHPDTGMEFCEREDEGHVFKVCHLFVWVYAYNFCLNVYIRKHDCIFKVVILLCINSG